MVDGIQHLIVDGTQSLIVVCWYAGGDSWWVDDCWWVDSTQPVSDVTVEAGWNQSTSATVCQPHPFYPLLDFFVSEFCNFPLKMT